MIDDLLERLEDEVGRLVWKAGQDLLTTMWRGRCVALVKREGEQAQLRVDNHWVRQFDADSERVTALFRNAEVAFLKDLVDRPTIEGRRLHVGRRWCCAVQVAEAVMGTVGYLQDHLRMRDPPREDMCGPDDFAIVDGQLLVGSSTDVRGRASIVVVVAELVDAFLREFDASSIAVDWGGDGASDGVDVTQRYDSN